MAAAPPSGPWVVLKFGGTSVSTAARWRSICAQIQENLRAEASPGVWVTISALTQVTNKLTQALEAASRADASHVEIVGAIVRQHFALAYEAGLFAGLEGDGGSGSMEQHDRWQHKWMASVFDESFVAPAAIDSAIPAELHPLLQELKVRSADRMTAGTDEQWADHDDGRVDGRTSHASWRASS
jgi:hypothetical protein